MNQPQRLASLTATAAASFEQPFEMLAACHDRIERMLALLARLRAHVGEHGADAQARQAARDVMRYFDQAAPQHHRDEELHVFPPLLALQAGLVARLLRDHRAMEDGWRRARVVLAAIEAGSPGPLQAADDQALHDFAALHEAHLQAEEELAYPAASALLDERAQAAMGAEMEARRRPPAGG